MAPLGSQDKPFDRCEIAQRLVAAGVVGVVLGNRVGDVAQRATAAE